MLYLPQQQECKFSYTAVKELQKKNYCMERVIRRLALTASDICLNKTRLFSEYQYIQRNRGITLYASYKFMTYLRNVDVRWQGFVCWQHNGIRAKLKTEDGNDIDTMFIDRRATHGSSSSLVDTL